jgi:hypothetical protein
MNIHIIEEDIEMNTFFCYIPNFITGYEEDNTISWLSQMNNFIPSYAYNNNISRLQKWHQQDNKYFCNKWINRQKKWISFNYDKKLNDIQMIVQQKINNLNLDKYNINIPKINSCLINKYRTGKDFIPPHRDTNISFGEYPTIISLSLGSSRDLLFKRFHKEDNELYQNLNFKLDSGSLFIMAGSSQKYYTHEIPITDTDETRYSFTFREFIQ